MIDTKERDEDSGGREESVTVRTSNPLASPVRWDHKGAEICD